MSEIYLTVGTSICIVMLISGYKSFRQPNSQFYRMAAWSSAAVLGIVLFVDSIFSILPRKEPQVMLEAETLVAAMKDTEEFLMRIPEVKRVEYSDDKGKLKMSVTVSSTMNDDDIAEFKDEITREFLHNLIDETDDPQVFLWGRVLYLLT